MDKLVHMEFTDTKNALVRLYHLMEAEPEYIRDATRDIQFVCQYVKDACDKLQKKIKQGKDGTFEKEKAALQAQKFQGYREWKETNELPADWHKRA